MGDEQQGGFFGEPSAQKQKPAVLVAAPPPAPVKSAPPSGMRGSGRSGQSILQYIAEKVEQKSKNVRVVFRNFDEDKSGSVDYTEFVEDLKSQDMQTGGFLGGDK